VGGNFNRNSCLRIPSHAGFSLSYRKSPKAYNGYFWPFFKEAVMLPVNELKAASAFALVRLASFAIFPTRSPLFKVPPFLRHCLLSI
jgi:hypothetical protein